MDAEFDVRNVRARAATEGGDELGDVGAHAREEKCCVKNY
jgi:hypothetical protein